MAITPVSKSNAKPFKVQNMVTDINDEPETIEALVQDIQAAPDGTELFETSQRVLNRWSKLSEQKLRFFSKVRIKKKCF